MRLEFFGETKLRMGKLLEVVATKLNLPVKQPLGLLMKNGGASSEPASPERSGLSDEMVRVVVGADCGIYVDGREWDIRGRGAEDDDSGGQESSHAKRRKAGDGIAASTSLNTSIAGSRTPKDQSWIIKTGQWRLRVQKRGGRVTGSGFGGEGGSSNGTLEWECILVAVKLDALSGERGRNLGKRFLGD